MIVLFHRVDDRYASDAISCSVDKFDQFCTFFRRYFEVVPLTVLVDKVRRGEDVSRHLVVTFDDGYRDNHVVAAPRLERDALPACFFIATDFIEATGSLVGPRRGNRVGVDELGAGPRSLGPGVQLGAHTCNHVDLGVVTGDEARHEIADSGERLTTETGSRVSLFSYPYGRQHQITEANRQTVRDAGYACCLSAYGGNVTPESSPYELRRIPVSQWHLNAYQFGFEAMTA